LTQPVRYMAAVVLGAAAGELIALLSMAAHLPVVMPGAMVASAVTTLTFLLLTRSRRPRPVQPEPCCCGRPGCDGRGPWPDEAAAPSTPDLP
jgi:hypothetical protein